VEAFVTMSRQVRRSLALALAGLLGGLGLVLALFGGDSLRRLTGRPGTEPPAAAAPAPNGSLRGLADPGALAGRTDPAIDFRDDKPGETPGDRAGTASGQVAGHNAGPGAPATAADAQPPAAEAPRFDIVRVEPNGDAVVAGRGAPDAAVELLVDGKPVARATADANGQFAIVPPALPAGASEIRLRMTGKDGRAATSQQSVAVNVAPGRDRQPLVALQAPDAATVVLSQPAAPGAASPGRPTPAPDSRVAAAQGTAQPVRIASVDVQDNGRLFVTATGIPGSQIRLYLNDTMIAPGGIGPDGRASFTIGRGIKPGQYQVRIDQIDPGTSKVQARAEVPLSVPPPSAVAAGDPAAPTLRGADPRGTTGPTRTAEAAGGMPAASGPDRLPPEAGGADREGAVFVPEISTARISRGDNLWRISQRTYGHGQRYTLIYDANQSQIRDPDLIYPGQIFVLPTDKRG
jgi:nucleoid-associated protein YgaU